MWLYIIEKQQLHSSTNLIKFRIWTTIESPPCSACNNTINFTVNGARQFSDHQRRSQCTVIHFQCVSVRNLVYSHGVLTTANHRWPCRLCHTALRLSLEWIATESVSLICRDALLTLRSPSVENETNSHFLEKQTARGQRVPPSPPPPLHSRRSFFHSYRNTSCQPKISSSALFFEHCRHAGRDFRGRSCERWKMLQDSSMVIVSRRVVHSGGWEVVFPFIDASPALKATTITQGGGMLSILLFSANLCGNQRSLAVSGVVFIEATV